MMLLSAGLAICRMEFLEAPLPPVMPLMRVSPA